jgi:hypothetical protein
VDPRVEEILRLSRHRGLPGSSPSIAADLQRMAKAARSESRRMGTIAGAWCDLMPALLLIRCRLDSFRSGTLTVHVDSSAALFEVDRVRREGAAAALRAATGGAVQRVKLRLAGPEPDHAAARAEAPQE